MYKAIFVDRDGTINLAPPKGQYIRKISEISIEDEVLETLNKFYKDNFKIIVISNQQGVGKKIMSFEDINFINLYFQKKAKEFGFRFEKFYYCFHLVSDFCECRKPEPGLLFRAADENKIDLTKSWFIGDSLNDILAGIRAHCRSIHLKCPTNGNICSCDYQVNNFSETYELVRSYG